MKINNDKFEEKKKMFKKIYKNIKEKSLPKHYYQKLFEAENRFYSNNSNENFQKLLSYYQQGTEYFTKLNSKEHLYFIGAIQNIISIQIKQQKKKENNTIKNNSIIEKNHKINIHFCEKDFKFESKKIIEKFNTSFNNCIQLFKKYNLKQEDNLRRNINKKIFKERFKKKQKKKCKSLIIKERRTTYFLKSNSIKNVLKKNYHNCNSSLKQRGTSYDVTKIINNNKITKILNEKKEKNKNDLTKSLMEFLKNYNKKFYYLFQTLLNYTLNELNIINEKAYMEMKNTYLEYYDNLKDYIALSENIDDLNIKNLILSLKNDLEEDLILIKKEEDNKINSLIIEINNKNLNDNISISNLNSDTIAQIAKVFK